MRILIIPEDPTLDQYILKPIVERMLKELEQPARVEVLQDPHIRGISEAFDRKTMAGIIADNRMIDLFLLMVDRDCNRFGNDTKAQDCQALHADKLIATCAWQEVEIWMLALHRKELTTPWSEIRDECDPKERWVDPFLRSKGWFSGLGRGRKQAMRALGQEYRGLLSVCPELQALQDSIAAWLKAKRP